MKHKIIEKNGKIFVKEKMNAFSLWRFVDKQGIEVHKKLNEDCYCEDLHRAERIVKYRLGLR